MKILLQILLCAGLLIFSASPVLAGDTVSVSTVKYPPLVDNEFIPELGYGMLRDIATEAFEAAGLQVRYDLLPMARNVWAITIGLDDCCLGSMEWFRKGGMEDEVDYIDLVNLYFAGFYLKDRFPQGISFDSLDDLKPYTFGNVRGSGSQSTLDRAGLKTDLVRNIELNIQKLAVGRFDFAVAFRVTGKHLVRNLYPDSQGQFAYMEKPLLKMPISMIFKKDSEVLKEKFRLGLEEIVRNGRYCDILVKYYAQKKVPLEAVPDWIKEILFK